MVKLRSEILPEKPGRSPANRSLERGIEVLRAFRPGSELLGNSDLVERTGLSKATVSRLAQTLAGVGMLELDAERRAYRLGPAVLSLAHSMRTGSRVLNAAAPLMRTLAETKRINVGLAAPDRDEMVYLESIRYSRRIVHRHVVSGQRVPMELTSLGRAYLAVAPALQRKALMAGFKKRRQEQCRIVLFFQFNSFNFNNLQKFSLQKISLATHLATHQPYNGFRHIYQPTME